MDFLSLFAGKTHAFACRGDVVFLTTYCAHGRATVGYSGFYDAGGVTQTNRQGIEFGCILLTAVNCGAR